MSWIGLERFLKNLKGLPSVRGVEHQIVLKDDAIPKQFYPYRYSHTFKDEIKKIAQELLANGIIRRSQSPFAFPVLLVRKKDGTWRMCVDYRYLNTLTIKHNYHIPIIDELLDELHVLLGSVNLILGLVTSRSEWRRMTSIKQLSKHTMAILNL